MEWSRKSEVLSVPGDSFPFLSCLPSVASTLPQSAVKRRQVQSPYELAYRRKPDLSDLIAAPGELVVVGWDGCKASAGEQTGEQG